MYIFVFLVAYLWSTPQSIHLFAHFILFHYIACLKDLKIYHHFDYNHTTAEQSFFFLTEPCRTLFFFPLRKLQCGYFPQIMHWFEYSSLILDLLAAIKSSKCVKRSVKLVKMEPCRAEHCFRNISQLQQFKTKIIYLS